jgi:hypothetical protein
MKLGVAGEAFFVEELVRTLKTRQNPKNSTNLPRSQKENELRLSTDIQPELEQLATDKSNVPITYFSLLLP